MKAELLSTAQLNVLRRCVTPFTHRLLLLFLLFAVFFFFYTCVIPVTVVCSAPTFSRYAPQVTLLSGHSAISFTSVPQRNNG